MLSFIQPEVGTILENTTLSHTFIRFFTHPQNFELFLNNNQAGSAHQSYGTDLSIVFKHFIASFCICLVEISLFSYLRPIFRTVYQPRCPTFPGTQALGRPKEGYLDWIKSTFEYNTNETITSGLDAFFFLRFLKILLVFFASCGTFNFLVLVPINYTGSSLAFSAHGLDRLSILNIAMIKVNRLNAHFVCSIATVGLFNILMFQEMKFVAKTRHSYLNLKLHRQKPSSKILLIENIPWNLRDDQMLLEFFSFSRSSPAKVWFADDFSEYLWNYRKANNAIDILESYLVRKDHQNAKSKVTSRRKFFDPPIICRPITIPLIKRKLLLHLPGVLRRFAFQKQVDLVEWCTKTIIESLESIVRRAEELENGNYVKLGRAFLLFDTQEPVYMTQQILLTSDYKAFNNSVAEVNARDILWENLVRDESKFCLFENVLINFVLVILIFLYVIPVSFISFFAQVPLITQLIPLTTFLNKLPEEIKEIISSFIPALALSLLTDVQLKIFRILLYYKGAVTGAQLALEVQKWYFAFLFVQQFLVVSILTSLLLILVQVVEKPASIPILLAVNIPKSSIFFFKFLSVRAFSFCGSKFLRLDQLISQVLVSKVMDDTPRKKFTRANNFPRVEWDSLYPSFSVCGAIGLTFCVISPFITAFMLLILLLTFLYYKHALKYQYSPVNCSETNGKLYLRALFHLYAGLYCFECCMFGIFLSSRNEAGDCPMKLQTVAMGFAMAITVSVNTYAHSRFKRLFDSFPQVSDFVDTDEFQSLMVPRYEGDTFYFHYCYRFRRPTLWVTDDAQLSTVSLVEELNRKLSYSYVTEDKILHKRQPTSTCSSAATFT